jgi:hypothetical protein
MLHRRFPKWGEAPGEVERRQRRGASGAPIVEKRTERGQGALLGLDSGISPENGRRYHSGNGHKRSRLLTIDQICAFFITTARKSRQKSYLSALHGADRKLHG